MLKMCAEFEFGQEKAFLQLKKKCLLFGIIFQFSMKCSFVIMAHSFIKIGQLKTSFYVRILGHHINTSCMHRG